MPAGSSAALKALVFTFATGTPLKVNALSGVLADSLRDTFGYAAIPRRSQR